MKTTSIVPKQQVWKMIKKAKDALPHEQKQYIKNRLSPAQKEYIRKLFKPQQNPMEKKLDRHRRWMLNLGFSERGYNEFIEMVKDDSKPKLKKKAAWELAVHHANQYTKEDAAKSMNLLKVALEGENGPKLMAKAAVIAAESLEILEKPEEAKHILKKALLLGDNPDIYLAMAGLEQEETKKLSLINQAFESFKLDPIDIQKQPGASLYDSLTGIDGSGKTSAIQTDQPTVSVIIPVYNAEDVIRTALDSVLKQTWKQLEVLVVDDCSKDSTISIVREYIQKDPRVKLIQAEKNGGPYVARNLALENAVGEFITCHDADDWSHPVKIETQVLHLMQNRSVIGNTSEQARATDNLKFFRRGKPGFYIFNNMSSFLFRRELVTNRIGFWDSVRFGADSEFIRRIKKVFGEKAVVDLKTGPLSFQRQSENSLTASGAFGYHGYFMGARKEYFEMHNYYHDVAQTLKYEFPLTKRPFPVPEPMKPDREKKPAESRHFDVIIASDFRLDGGSNLSNIEEIKAQKKLGLRTGLVQMARYDYNVRKKINPKIRELQDDEQVQMLVYGERVTCDVLIVRYPPVLQEKQKFLPEIEAKQVHVIINQTPMSNYGPTGVMRYNFKQAAENLKTYFQQEGVWHPIGPLVRDSLHQYHQEELKYINLAEEDWVNIIDLDEWVPDSAPKKNHIPRIGRHSRDAEVKWPASVEEMLAVYPDTADYEIHVLGGAETPKQVLGKLPKNWHVHDFGEVEAKEFLAGLDVFVYYTHPDWIESFGRVIIEAMAAGVPAILPHSYQPLFKEAAIYAEPAGVQQEIDRLIKDPVYYQAQVEKASSFINEQFGYKKHSKRIGKEVVYG